MNKRMPGQSCSPGCWCGGLQIARDEAASVLFLLEASASCSGLALSWAFARGLDAGCPDPQLGQTGPRSGK